MVNERKVVKDEIGAIDNLAIKDVDKALAKTSSDGASMMSPPKKGKYGKGYQMGGSDAGSDGGYRIGHSGW